MKKRQQMKSKSSKMENSDKELDAIIAEELGILPGKKDNFEFLEEVDAWDFANEVGDLKYEI